VDSLRLFAVGASGSYANYVLITPTVPFTWATNDIFSIKATYEAA